MRQRSDLPGWICALVIVASLPLFAHAEAQRGEPTAFTYPTENSLEQLFKNPPQDAKPQVWWHWMYGNITKEGITKDLELMKKLGIGGATQFHNAYLKGHRATPKGPVRFNSPEYRELVQYAIKECHRLGMTMGLQICDGFSQTGGPWIEPEMGMRALRHTRIAAQGGREFTCQTPENTVLVLACPGSIDDMTPPAQPTKSRRSKEDPHNAMIDPGSPYLTKGQTAIKGKDIIDLTSRPEPDGSLSWTPPEGDWVVMIFHDELHPATNHPASPEGEGLECSKLDSDAVDLVFDNYVGPLIDDAGELAGKTLQHVLIDSWECGYQSWSRGFVEEFKKRRGYDPTPYLPALARIPVESVELSNRFLCDFRVTLDDLVCEQYYGHLRDRLNERGMQLHAEVLYGWHQMFGSPIRQYGMVDVPMNEIWMTKQHPGNRNRNLGGRAYTGYAATAGHVYGKKIIKDESFTVGGGKGDFSFVPSMMKPAADFALCRGTSRFVLHTSVHQPDDKKPGWTHGLNGVNFHRNNTWWPYAGGFLSYLARCSYMLQQGVFVADVCRYVGQEDTYSEGYGELPLAGLPEGYRADHCDNTVLLERMDVKDGRVVLPDGTSYAVLLLADKKTMAPKILEKLALMAQKGATIIGPKPEHAPGLTDYPQCDAEVKRLADQLWGQGKIRDIPLNEALTMAPDFEYKATPESRINFIHRKLPDTDIYFIATAGDACVAGCTFRVSGKSPQVFDPMTGEIYDLPEFKDEDGRTHIKIELEAQGSKMIVFRPKPAGRDLPQRIVATSIPIPGPWEVSFEPNRGAPEGIKLAKLMSLSEHADAGVRHFSGVATYTTSFDLPTLLVNQSFVLELGEVNDLAEVMVNGTSAGTLWRPPFKIDITPYLKPGPNHLEVKVVNTWVNRLIGDQKIPAEKRVAEVVPSSAPWYVAESKLLPSGLLGPVSIEVAK